MRKTIIATLVIASFIIFVWYLYNNLPFDYPGIRYERPMVGVDWKGAFRPAAFHFLNGESPYQEKDFFNPPWVMAVLAPIALLPENLGIAVIYALNIYAIVYVALKLKVSPFLLPILFVPWTSNSFLSNSWDGNIDGLIALGFVLPPQIGLFFVLAKPQIGLPVAAYWLYKSYREKGIRGAVKILIPVGIAVCVSIALYGLWFLKSPGLADVWWNASLWPQSIPFGIAFVLVAIIRDKIGFAIAAGPLLSPYIAHHTWGFLYMGMFMYAGQIWPYLIRWSCNTTAWARLKINQSSTTTPQ